MRCRRFLDGFLDFLGGVIDFALDVLGDMFDSRW